MQNHFISGTLAVTLLALLSACGTTNGAKSVAVPTTSASIIHRGELAQGVGDAVVGDTIQLPAGNTTGASFADVVAEYAAASGRRCRQVIPHGGVGDMRIACEHKNASWYWVRSLTTSALEQPLPAVAMTESVVSDDAALLAVGNEKAAAAVNDEIAVNDEETLWAFSRRTTGKGIHWPHIAELNNIEDARAVLDTDTLLVPSHLIRQGL